MNLKRIRTSHLKRETYDDLTDRNKVTQNSTSNYGSTPSSNLVKNIRSIDFQSR
jgi:hypothetical protein